MNFLVMFLLAAFIAGGTGLGRWVRERPIVLIFISALVAASFYSIRVVL
jgi:hypothetical protein